MRGNHRWTENDEIIALYLYRNEDKELSFSPQELAEQIGMGWSSMSKKIANFRFLDGRDGLEGCSPQCEAVYRRCQELSAEEFTTLARQAVAEANEQYARHVETVLARRAAKQNSLP